MVSEVAVPEYGWSADAPHTEAYLLQPLQQLLVGPPPPPPGSCSILAAATVPLPSSFIDGATAWWVSTPAPAALTPLASAARS